MEERAKKWNHCVTEIGSDEYQMALDGGWEPTNTYIEPRYETGSYGNTVWSFSTMVSFRRLE